jgi:hypothetical protein
MGHSEMLLAVAGLDDNEINQRTGKLASGDWSGFSSAEAQAFEVGCRLTNTPPDLDADTVARLKTSFGDLRAMDVIWHAAWCNYMTRVADAFQLPLERDNVFAPPDQLP